MKEDLERGRIAAWLSLFASSATLLCCALPSLLVALGMGAVVAGVAANFSALIVLSRYKGIVFLVSAALLILSSYFQHKMKRLPCPADPGLAKACARTRRWSNGVTIFSILIWMAGAFFAFVAPWIGQG